MINSKLDEFINKVRKQAENRVSVWVDIPANCNEKVREVIYALFNAEINCQNCSKCCEGNWFLIIPLLVGEPEKIMQSMNWSSADLRNITRIEKLFNSDVLCLVQPCPFLIHKKCSIYAIRPKVCEWFPINIGEDKIQVNISCPEGRRIYTKLAESLKINEWAES